MERIQGCGEKREQTSSRKKEAQIKTEAEYSIKEKTNTSALKNPILSENEPMGHNWALIGNGGSWVIFVLAQALCRLLHPR